MDIKSHSQLGQTFISAEYDKEQEGKKMVKKQREEDLSEENFMLRQELRYSREAMQEKAERENYKRELENQKIRAEAEMRAHIKGQEYYGTSIGGSVASAHGSGYSVRVDPGYGYSLNSAWS
jgi:hypothetical protein